MALGSEAGVLQDLHRSLSGMAPSDLATDCQLVSDEARRRLRSANSRTCVIRRTYNQFGDRCFAAAGPKLWNSLLVQLRLTFTYLNVKGAYSSPWKPISEIRGVTCRMGTHSVACHPTQVNRYCFESMHGALVSRVTGRLLSNDVGPRP